MTNHFGFWLATAFSTIAVGLGIAAAFYPTYMTSYRVNYPHGEFKGTMEYGVDMLRPQEIVKASCVLHSPWRSEQEPANQKAECDYAASDFHSASTQCPEMITRGKVLTAFLVLAIITSAISTGIHLLSIVKPWTVHDAVAPTVTGAGVIFFLVAWAVTVETFNNLECTTDGFGTVMSRSMRDSGRWTLGPQFSIELAAFGFCMTALGASLFGHCSSEPQVGPTCPLEDGDDAEGMHSAYDREMSRKYTPPTM